MIKTKVVKRYRAPRYPAKLQVLADPALLRQNVPPAWQAVPQLAGAVALFLSANTTLCRGADKGAGSTGVAVVAPIFNHGEGRGATGCVVVAPPVFLSEEEALQVIREELGKGGVDASQTSFAVPGVKIKPTVGDFRRTGEKSEYVPPSEKPLQASAADPRKKVAVKFLSRQNYHQLGGATSLSTVQVYDLRTAAKSVAETVRKDGRAKVYFGAFYDPCGYAKPKDDSPTTDPKVWQQRYEAAAKTSKAESERLLRLQVQDFVKWLQAQGAI